MVTNQIVIDASGLVVGRLAAQCAKKALTGHEIKIYNIGKAVLSGNPKQIVEVYRKRRTMTDHANPENAAKWPRRPYFFFKKILSGMMPASRRGKQALALVKAYVGSNVEKCAGVKRVKHSSKLGFKFISLQQLCNDLGGHQYNG